MCVCLFFYAPLKFQCEDLFFCFSFVFHWFLLIFALNLNFSFFPQVYSFAPSLKFFVLQRYPSFYTIKSPSQCHTNLFPCRLTLTPQSHNNINSNILWPIFPLQLFLLISPKIISLHLFSLLRTMSQHQSINLNHMACHYTIPSTWNNQLVLLLVIFTQLETKTTHFSLLTIFKISTHFNSFQLLDHVVTFPQCYFWFPLLIPHNETYCYRLEE